MASIRVTVTLPPEAVDEMDRFDENRSRFVLEAVRREIGRRRRQELRRSLREPHPETATLASEGLGEWASRLPTEVEPLVEPAAGTPVKWIPGRGWTERKR